MTKRDRNQRFKPWTTLLRYVNVPKVDIKGLANDIGNSNKSKFSFRNEEGCVKSNTPQIHRSDNLLFAMLILGFQ